MKIAITGAAGWLGRSVTAALESSHDLVLVDNVHPSEATIFDPKAPGGRSPAPLQTNWPYHQVDIQDEVGLAKPLEDVEVVVHLAAWPTGDWDRVRSTMSTNVMGTLNVFEVARGRGARRIVNASSINAFGTFYWRVSSLRPVHARLPLSEDEVVVPEDPYSLSKAVTELVGGTYQRAFGLEVASLRFAGVMSEATYDQLLEEGLPPSEAWDDLLWGWIHIADVTQGIVRATQVERLIPLPITLAAGDTKAPEPTMSLLERFRPELVPHLREPLNGRAGLFSITRAQTQLGYRPMFTLDGAVHPSE